MALLEVDGMSVTFKGLRGSIEVLRDVSFVVEPGEVVALVGESGSGKSVTSLAIMGLLGKAGALSSGVIRFEDTDLASLPPATRRDIRGRDLAMIFQEPGTCLNPVYRVGFQIAEALVEHGLCDGAEAERRAISLMERVGIPAASERFRDYPHQFSGGMKQRIMIAMALACNPRLLIADEPTTALDVTIQAQILNLILDLQRERSMATLLITHDMGVVAQMADRVVVMYAGEVVETATAQQLFTAPAHPYTRLLLRSIPTARVKQDALPLIDGTTPPATDFPQGCRFHPRCPLATRECAETKPDLTSVATCQAARCLRLDLPAEALEEAMAI
ncbi:ATP-binding cassette domain-containing protein [Rhodobacteraceae bacterium 2CG4]|uniref:ATP-binding cassette domain-containing protein n=1 Tax=Halovulum marinum TaxID=2662447 RepID=A0A6L5Z4B0_9RHOB|nr:ABC transporter ATP-binding protein [Halovulum marinum]MSU90930.1 ATP-binding cassette domain-containing protein [Halovulum marinum]